MVKGSFKGAIGQVVFTIVLGILINLGWYLVRHGTIDSPHAGILGVIVVGAILSWPISLPLSITAFLSRLLTGMSGRVSWLALLGGSALYCAMLFFVVFRLIDPDSWVGQPVRFIAMTIAGAVLSHGVCLWLARKLSGERNTEAGTAK
jgi:hypothetical protein